MRKSRSILVRHLKWLILILIAAGGSWALPLVAVAADLFTVTLPAGSTVTMGDSSAVLSFTITNDPSSSQSIETVQITFYDTVYSTSNATNPPSGWTASIGFAVVDFSTSTNQIPPGGSQTFDIVLVGTGSTNIPSAASDQTDTLKSISTDNDLTGPLPTWQRKALSMILSASPSSLGNSETISISGMVTNRSSGTLNNIAPSALTVISSQTAAANYSSGPTPASATSLSSGESAFFDWSYTASSAGTVQFQGSATDGASTSTSVTVSSDSVAIGDFTSSISLSPASVTNQMAFTITMTVSNNGPTSLGNVTPSTLTFSTSGPATHSITSGPSPTSISSLAPGTSGTFQWTAKVFGGDSGDTFNFQGFATSGALTTLTATSNQGNIPVFAGTVSPISISSGNTNVTLTFGVTNSPSNNISVEKADINIPSNPSGFVIQSAVGSNSITSGWSASVGSEKVNFDYASTDLIDPGEEGKFDLTFSQTPSVVSNTEANFTIDLFLSGGGEDSVDVTLLITAFDLSITATPQSGIAADGISTSTINATLTSGGSPVVGKTVTFTTTNGTLSSSTAVTDSSGVATVTLTAPTSTTNTSATVTGSYLGASNNVVVSFTGVTTPNLVYVGGTLSPTSVSSGQSNVSFSVKVNNTGGSSVTLNTASTFSFTDGTNAYTSNLSSPTFLNTGATNATLTFDPANVSSSFTAGSYNPTMSLTDGGSYNQSVPVSDSVTVTAVPPAPNMSISASVDNPSAPPGDALTYTITYSNSGTGSGENVQVIPKFCAKIRGIKTD